MTVAEPAIRIDRSEGVAVLTINRPAVRNAIDRDTALALELALDELDRDEDLRAGVLVGAGGSFCAGMDLKAYAATGERPAGATRGLFGIVERPPRTPLIAAVEGNALGGGFEIALACDLIVAAGSASFGLPEATRGLVAAAGGVLRVSERLPRNLALELTLTGARISAGRAYELGIANRVVPDGEAQAVACELAEAIASNAPLAVAASKQIVDECGGWARHERFARQAPIVERVRDSRDAREGARAFVEKRTPTWSGQ